MRVLTYIMYIAILAALNCRTNSTAYSIESSSKTVISNDSCHITVRYPIFISKDEQKHSVRELNEILRRFPDYDYYVCQCEKQQRKTLSVESDYKLTKETPEILSIEFMTVVNLNGIHRDTVFHSLVIDPKNISVRNGVVATPEMQFEHFDRQILYRHVKRFNEQYDKHVNLLAYEKGSNYVITWGIAKGLLLLYVGGEGEGFGRYKIEIPLTEFDQ